MGYVEKYNFKVMCMVNVILEVHTWTLHEGNEKKDKKIT
jgi:hypothetical protein